RIDVRQDAEGFQYGVVTAEPGKLAYYKQKRDNATDEWIEGEAEVIEYNSKVDDVRFIRRAVMRRLVGATVSDETSGPVIVYDQSKDVFTVAGTTVPPGASVAAGSGRVRALLTPRGAASAPAPAPAAGTGLRPSNTLGGDARK
ncbi:MAG: lipopolysaccharide transport periplasmic protein LptA, partial [Comamonadaceae bacterium]